MEGSEQEFFDHIPAMTLWNVAVKFGKANQAGNHTYKKRNKQTRPLTLLDLEESRDDSDSAGENSMAIRCGSCSEKTSKKSTCAVTRRIIITFANQIFL